MMIPFSRRWRAVPATCKVEGSHVREVKQILRQHFVLPQDDTLTFTGRTSFIFSVTGNARHLRNEREVTY